MSTKKHAVRVIYKSGATVDVKCNSFKCKFNAFNALTGIAWDGAIPEPLYAGVDEIAAVWQIS